MLRTGTARLAPPEEMEDRFGRITLDFLRDTGAQGCINEDGSIRVFHGTSLRNARSILESGAFKGFPWFATDRSVAERFARQTGSRIQVLELDVAPGSILPCSGYLSARMEGLRRRVDGVWSLVPADEALAGEVKPALPTGLRAAAVAPVQAFGREQVRSEAFQAWFGRSRVVDPDGEPLRLFHGATVDFVQFDPASSKDGGLHFGAAEQASMRISGAGKRLIPVYLRVENPRRSKDTGGSWHAKIASAKAAGHDGIVYLNRYEGLPLERVAELEKRGLMARLDQISDAEFRRLVPEARDSWIVFSPTQIKSAIGNCGAFDPRNPDLRA